MKELNSIKIIAIDHGYGHKEFVPDKCMDFRFNGTDYHINIVGCSIYPQGYPAIVEHLADFKGTNLLADIGSTYFECITKTAADYVSNIFATLRRYEYNPDLMRLYVVGGGGCLLKHFGNCDKEHVTIIDDICATAKGYEFLAYHALRRKEQS